MAGLWEVWKPEEEADPLPHLHKSDDFPELGAPADPRPNAGHPARDKQGDMARREE